MRTNLLPHNKTAYKKVMKAFETSDKTCVIHPTGTGKSYLIAAVSESYKKVLILAPNIFVLGQVENVTNWHPTIDYMTYAYLNSRGSDKQYDLIVLDEFHRAGATEWGDAVKKLLSQQHGKVLGTTATPIRYLDEGRNMAEEIFDGNIASQMSIGEAWNRNILPIPTYVTGLFDFKNTAEEVRERIKAAKRITDKDERLRQLAQFELDWERSDGMPQVIRKHISQDTKRVIVFCNSVKHLNTMKPTIADWFKQAGLAVADIYSICHETDSENTDQMEAFEQDTNDGVKIMLAVNMLNEGVHIPRVDAVIMLRTTASRIIYMQQLGRCLTAANTARPVVLDMVDNISNANVIGNIKDEFEALEQQDYEKDGEHKKTPRQFTITDYTQGIQKVVEKLTEGTARIIPLCERLENIEMFVKEHGRLPREIEREAYRDWAILLINKDREPRVLELMEEYPRYKEESQLAAELTEFIKSHERLPTKGDLTIYRYLGKVFKAKREQWLNDYPELKEQFNKHYHWRDTTNERIAIVVEFYKQHKRFPQTVEEGTKHLQYLYKKGLKDKLNELVEPYRPKEELRAEPEPPKQRGRSIEELITTVVLFTSEHGRLPKTGDDQKAISAWARLYYREHHPAAEAIFKQYSDASPDKIEERIALVEKFFDEHHHIPWRRDGEAREAWTWIRTRYKDDPRVIAIKSKDKSYQSVNKV